MGVKGLETKGGLSVPVSPTEGRYRSALWTLKRNSLLDPTPLGPGRDNPPS